MENIITIKNGVCAVAGTIGAYLSFIFGGWNAAMLWLTVFMSLDYVTGLIVAGVFKHSPKSDTGALESRACLKGLFRKGGMLVLVLIGYAVDDVLGTQYIMDGVIYALMVNELLSLLENLGLMGVEYPDVLANALELLRHKAGSTEPVGAVADNTPRDEVESAILRTFDGKEGKDDE